MFNNLSRTLTLKLTLETTNAAESLSIVIPPADRQLFGIRSNHGPLVQFSVFSLGNFFTARESR